MSSITRGRVEEFISNPASLVSAEESEILELARIALASLDAEPVAWLWSSRKHPSEVTLVRPEDDEKAEAAQWSGWSCQALYAEPQVTASVPEDLLHMAASAIEDLLSNKDRSGAGVWADMPARLRRAAMLQGAEPDFREISNSSTNNFRENAETSTNCPCCGRKPLKNKTCSVAGCDGKHVARGFCIKHYAIERKKDPSRRESIRAADKRYRARKAAAPQQEVKP
ncbi:hypothetical protein [uncultured Enterobacter sp.]|uniref:hypothetical protein n=1 Tax=uncultured Enterobacter sp. TaxID=238202 RepID=UPI0025CE8B70|nr:hypothetical protein [uncultured Enterobacter sp.]